MTDTQPRVPAPSINAESRPFWAATAVGKLMLKRCEDCEEFHYYPRSICPFCMSDKTRWQESAGTGRIYSYSIFRRAAQPYCIAYVTLEEGVSMMTNIIETDFDDIHIGLEVCVRFVDTGAGCALPYFKKAQP